MECGRWWLEVQTFLLQHCALCKFHLTDGQNTREKIIRGRRSKYAWSNCISRIPFILSGSPNKCWPHTFNASVITTWRLGLRVTRGASNKSLCNMTSTRRMALSSTGASLWRREAGERKKESDTQQGPVPWRDRERGGSPDNDSTDQQWWRPWKWSQHKLFYIMATVMTMIFKMKKGVMWWDEPFFQISIGTYE